MTPWYRGYLGRLGITLVAIALGAAVVVGISDRILTRHVRGTSAPPSPSYRQIELPFPGLKEPSKLAVDAAGNVYVTDQNRVLELAAGATSPTELPFAGLSDPAAGIAADPAGNVYVAEWSGGHRVLELAAGATSPTELPFGDINPVGVAVDPAGNVYVADYLEHDRGRVLKLAPGAAGPTEVPFTVQGTGRELRKPWGIAVDAAGGVYVTTFDGPVLKRAAGATGVTVLPFRGLDHPGGVAVDNGGTVYVEDIGAVHKLVSGATNSTEVAFVGISPSDVAVDGAGNVYVVNAVMPNARILKLPPE